MPGQLYMAETGLNRNYFRDYDPNTGRYIESDPIGQHGGLNTYAYVLNSPTDSVDPLGTLRQGGGFSSLSDPRWQSVQQAEARLREELQKAYGCHSESKQDSCIPSFVSDKLNNLLYPFTSRLDLSFVSFDPGMNAGECASGATPSGPGINDLESKCMGNLCGTSTP
jgi:RHS repeat-associated protein